VQNSIKLHVSAAVHELSCYQRKNFATMLKTILPSLPRAVKTQFNAQHSLSFRAHRIV